MEIVRVRIAVLISALMVCALLRYLWEAHHPGAIAIVPVSAIAQLAIVTVLWGIIVTMVYAISHVIVMVAQGLNCMAIAGLLPAVVVIPAMIAFVTYL